MPTTKSFSSHSFAAFIMTYERPEILLDTLMKLQEQTLPPSYVLIVDNSESRDTEFAVKALVRENVGYYRVGFNSGPAGAAKIGLEQLCRRGFSWIYWGDDDNPPVQKDTFKNLFHQLQKCEQGNIGIIGGKGGVLNIWSGRINTFSNLHLSQNEVIDVDMVPGGGTLLVNADVVKQEILPREKLFFGFEELDFCLRVKKEGFRVLVHTDTWLQDNYSRGLTGLQYKWKDSFFGREDYLWRGYYSTRNLLYIYYHQRYYSAFLFLFLKSILKSVAGFRYGRDYGRRNFRLQGQAILHFLTGKFGPYFEENGYFKDKFNSEKL